MFSLYRSIFLALLGVNLVAVVVIFLLFTPLYLYSFEVAFLSSTLVLMGSLRAYQSMVRRGVEAKMVAIDDGRDALEKIEDPYDLYSQEEPSQEERSLGEVVKEARAKLKKNRPSLWTTIKRSRTSLSFYRLGAYVVLVLGFLYLNRHGLLHTPTYLVALGLSPLVVVMVLLRNKGIASKN
jgi:hypothetical protein